MARCDIISFFHSFIQVVLSAIDFDTADIISYRIVSGNRDDCFKLDARSGKLTLNCDLNSRRGVCLRLEGQRGISNKFVRIGLIIWHLRFG